MHAGPAEVAGGRLGAKGEWLDAPDRVSWNRGSGGAGVFTGAVNDSVDGWILFASTPRTSQAHPVTR